MALCKAGEGKERTRHLVWRGSVFCFVNSVRSKKNTGIIVQGIIAQGIIVQNIRIKFGNNASGLSVLFATRRNVLTGRFIALATTTGALL